MYRNLFFLFHLVLVLALAGPAWAICPNVLATYEPDEVNDLVVRTNPSFSPTLEANWPVLGGLNGVPEATQGDYLCKFTWTGETDRKIEVGHYWKHSTFDLCDVNYIAVDVYFATESALPKSAKENVSIWSRWNSNDHWIKCERVPPTIREWYTALFYVGNLCYNDVNNIDALTFEEMGDPSDPSHVAGRMYIDNLRLLKDLGSKHIGRPINFSGYWWSVLHADYPIGAGPNFYTDDPNEVWVDRYGPLHLNILQKDSNWYCSEVIGNENLGYGTYVYTVKVRLEPLDPNIILGLFVYDVPDADDNPREIDVEITRWWDANEPNNAQYVVQPDLPGHKHRFYINEHKTTTHEISWEPDKVSFRTYYGDYPLRDPCDMIHTWCYKGHDIPAEGCENPRINFYLLAPKGAPPGTPGGPPTDGNEAEIIIKNFLYVPLPNSLTCWELSECSGQPFGDANCDGCVNFLDLGMLKNCFFSVQCDPCYNCCADFNHDEQVDFIDLGILKANFFNCGYSPSTGNQNCPP
jgi:hypothetical protein